jgi:molybdopterin converting factor small subunit
MEITIAVPCTVGELRAHLARECPEAAAALNDQRVRTCIADAVVSDCHVVSGREPVELLAPVSGG